MTTTKTTEQIKEAIIATVKDMCELYYKITLKQKDEYKRFTKYLDLTSSVLSALSFQIGYLGIENGDELLNEIQKIRDEYLKKL